MQALFIGLGLLYLFSKANEGAGIFGYATRKSGWFVPYVERDGKRFQHVPGKGVGKSGVYFIKKISTGEKVYIGSSSGRLYDTLFRHFRQWSGNPYSGRGYGNVYYPDWENYKVRVIECGPQQALRVEKYFIRKYKPRDNPLQYDNLTDAEVKQVNAAAQKVDDTWEETPW